jgi:hypothetical protein
MLASALSRFGISSQMHLHNLETGAINKVRPLSEVWLEAKAKTFFFDDLGSI